MTCKKFLAALDYLCWMYDEFWYSAVVPWNIKSHYVNDSKSDEVHEQNAKVDFNVCIQICKMLPQRQAITSTLNWQSCEYVLHIATFICIYFYKVDIYKPYIHTYIFQELNWEHLWGMKLDLASKKSVFKSYSFVMVVCFMLHELRPLMWISGRYIHHRI